MRLTLAILLWLWTAGVSHAQPGVPHWSDPDLGRAIIEGAADPQTLWLRGQTGAVVRYDRRSGARAVVAEVVVDLLQDGPHLWALSKKTDFQVTIRDLNAPDSPPIEPSLTGAPVALFRHGGGLGILTTSMILTQQGEVWRRLTLPASVAQRAWVRSDDAGSLYLGLNQGEWGGGLRRIDLSTGAIAFVREPAADLCGGALNSDCSPVVGLADGGRAGCVIVGSGLAHLSGRMGRAFRVCGEVITPVFSSPILASESPLGRTGLTWTFYSLVETPGGWLAVSDGRYFRARGDRIQERTLPVLGDWSGLRISEEEDGVLFIQSACCWGSETMILSSTLAIPVIRRTDRD